MRPSREIRRDRATIIGLFRGHNFKGRTGTMPKAVIATPRAPSAIGTYSQAVRCGDTIYLSGQIGLDPATMQLAEGIDAQVKRVFDNLKAVAAAAGAGAGFVPVHPIAAEGETRKTGHPPPV